MIEPMPDWPRMGVASPSKARTRLASAANVGPNRKDSVSGRSGAIDLRHRIDRAAPFVDLLIGVSDVDRLRVCCRARTESMTPSLSCASSNKMKSASIRGFDLRPYFQVHVRLYRASPARVHALRPQTRNAGAQVVAQPVGGVIANFFIDRDVEKPAAIRRRERQKRPRPSAIIRPISNGATSDVLSRDGRHLDGPKSVAGGKFVRWLRRQIDARGQAMRARRHRQVSAPCGLSTFAGKPRRAESAISLLKAR